MKEKPIYELTKEEIEKKIKECTIRIADLEITKNVLLEQLGKIDSERINLILDVGIYSTVLHIPKKET